MVPAHVGGDRAGGSDGRALGRIASPGAGCVKELAPGLWQLRAVPDPNGINVYLMGDVLVDAATRCAGGGSSRSCRGARSPRTRSRTPTPTTRARATWSARRSAIPFWVRRARRRRGRGPAADQGASSRTRLNGRIFYRTAGPGHPVDRRLREGDEVAGFTCSTCRATPRPRGLLARVRPRARARRRAQQHGRAHGRPGAARAEGHLHAGSRRRNRALDPSALAALEPALVLLRPRPSAAGPAALVEFCRGLAVPSALSTRTGPGT